MFGDESATTPRQELPELISQALGAPGSILLGGPSQSGKSHTLSAVEQLLAHQVKPDLRVRGSDQHAAARIRSLPAGSVYLLDDADLAPTDTIAAITELLIAGGSGVETFNPERSAGTYTEALDALAAQHPEAESLFSDTRTFRIAPLSASEALVLAREFAGTDLDSVSLRAAAELCWGRPGWLLDALKLAQAGRLTSTPFPDFESIDVADLHLPAIRAAVATVGSIHTPEHRAAALALASFEPRTLESITALIGAESSRALREARVLIPWPPNRRLFGVPQLYGVAVRHLHEEAQEHPLRHVIAEQQLTYEALGVPLSPREGWACVSAFRPDAATAPSDEVLGAHARLVAATAHALIGFGRPEARELLMRSRCAASISPFERIRAATVLGGSLAGVRAIHALRDDQEQASVGSLARSYTEHVLLGEITPNNAPEHTPPATAADRVFGAYRGTTPLTQIQLYDVTEATKAGPSSCADDELLALMAAQLIALEAARYGMTVPEDNSARDRVHRLIEIAVAPAPQHSDAHAGAVVTEAIVAMLLGNSIEPLRPLTERLTGAEWHAAWFTHLNAARSSLVAGDLRRASLEWHRLPSALPRFLPERVRSSITMIGSEIAASLANADERLQSPHAPRQAGSASAEQPTSPAGALLRYLTGELNAVIPAGSADSDATLFLSEARGAHPSQLRRLAEQHLAAARTGHPRALQRTGEALIAAGYWSAAALALTEAQGIFQRRRAAGGVATCSELIATLEHRARIEYPDFSLAQRPHKSRASLTERELATARLAATNMSNREIAAELGCSVRTVESHLAAARSKLGATSRGEIARLLAQHDGG